MRAFAIDDYSPGLLLLHELEPPPTPAAGEVQLSLLGTSINPVDRLIASGYGAPLFNTKRKFPVILGRDAVARVVAVGPDIRDLHPGQRVLVAASPRTGGTYADRFNLPRRCLAPITDLLSDTMAAGLGYAGLTAMQALASAGISAGTAQGRQLCINGASGGLGAIALLLASRWGAQVTAVASLKNHARLQALAPCTVVDYRDSGALNSIQADIVLNCAAPPSGEHRVTDPLLQVVRNSTARHRAYVTTVTPVLTNVTSQGAVLGLASSGAKFLRQNLMLRIDGVAYHWIMFKESPTQLLQLAEFFSQQDIPDIIGGHWNLNALPEHFNEARAGQTAGKAVFLADSR